MSTKKYKNTLAAITSKIHKSNLSHKDTIVIGDNSSGKSEILRNLVELSFDKYYFIDAINRVFDSSKIIDKEISVNTKFENVSTYRLSENIFNLKDSFNIYGDGTGYIELIFKKYMEEIKILLKKFINIDIDLKEVNYGKLSSEYKLFINNEIENLSSGYQAIIRLFLELIYINKNKGDNKVTIVIDEIDEYLSSKNKSNILGFLKDEFNEFNWVITTHSADVIASAKDFNLIILKNDNYQCLDSNDFNTITDVQEIFRNLYDKTIDDNKDDINITLRRLLSLKITGCWSEVEEEDLKKVESNDLTNSQLLLINQIKNWSK